MGIKESKSNTIKRFYKSRHNIWAVKEEYRFELMTKSATIIQRTIRAFLKRMPFYHSYIAKKNALTYVLH